MQVETPSDDPPTPEEIAKAIAAVKHLAHSRLVPPGAASFSEFICVEGSIVMLGSVYLEDPDAAGLLAESGEPVQQQQQEEEVAQLLQGPALVATAEGALVWRVLIVDGSSRVAGMGRSRREAGGGGTTGSPASSDSGDGASSSSGGGLNVQFGCTQELGTAAADVPGIPFHEGGRPMSSQMMIGTWGGELQMLLVTSDDQGATQQVQQGDDGESSSAEATQGGSREGRSRRVWDGTARVVVSHWEAMVVDLQRELAPEYALLRFAVPEGSTSSTSTSTPRSAVMYLHILPASQPSPQQAPAAPAAAGEGRVDAPPASAESPATRTGAAAAVTDEHQGRFSPLAHVLLLVLPSPAAEELVRWVQEQGLSQEQLQPVLLDMAMVVQAVGMRLATAAGASRAGVRPASVAAAPAAAAAHSSVGGTITSAAQGAFSIPDPAGWEAAAAGGGGDLEPADSAEAISIFNMGAAAAARLIPCMADQSLRQCGSLMEAYLQLILDVSATDIAGAIAVVVAAATAARGQAAEIGGRTVVEAGIPGAQGHSGEVAAGGNTTGEQASETEAAAVVEAGTAEAHVHGGEVAAGPESAREQAAQTRAAVVAEAGQAVLEQGGEVAAGPEYTREQAAETPVALVAAAGTAEAPEHGGGVAPGREVAREQAAERRGFIGAEAGAAEAQGRGGEVAARHEGAVSAGSISEMENAAQPPRSRCCR